MFVGDLAEKLHERLESRLVWLAELRHYLAEFVRVDGVEAVLRIIICHIEQTVVEVSTKVKINDSSFNKLYMGPDMPHRTRRENGSEFICTSVHKKQRFAIMEEKIYSFNVLCS